MDRRRPRWADRDNVQYFMLQDAEAHAESLIKELEALEYTGDTKRPIEMAANASEWILANLSENHHLSRKVLGELAHAYESANTYDKAEEIWLRLVQLAKDSDGPDHPNYAIALNNLGESYREAGQFAKAEPIYLESATAAARSFGDSKMSFFTKANLGLLYKQSGRYAEAETLYKEVLDGIVSLSDDTNPLYANTLRNLAALYDSTGRLAEAAHCYRRALDLIRRAFGEDYLGYDPHTVTSLAYVEAKIGRHDLAISLLSETMKSMLRTGQNKPFRTVPLLVCMGYVFVESGDFEAAELAYRNALKALEHLPGHKARDHHDLIMTGLATVYLRTGQYSDAERLLSQSLGKVAYELGETSLPYASSLNNLAIVYCDTGRFSEAATLFVQSLAILENRTGRVDPRVTITMAGLAMAHEALGDHAKARALFKDAAHRSEEFLWESFVSSSDRQRLELFAEMDTFIVRYLAVVLFGPDAGDEEIADAYDFAIRRKGMAMEALSLQQRSFHRGQYPNLEEKIARLRFLRAQLSKAFVSRFRDPESPYVEPIQQMSAEREYLEAEVARMMPDSNLSGLMQSAGLQAVAKAIPSDSVLIDFVFLHKFDPKAVPARGEHRWQESRYVAFVTHGGRPDSCRMVDLGDGKAIDDIVGKYWTQLAHPSNNEFGAEAIDLGVRVREVLIDPLVQFLGDKRRLLVCPDGILSILPLAAVPTCSDRLLIDDFEISYVGNVRDVIRPEGDALCTQPIVIADPSFELRADVKAEDRREVEQDRAEVIEGLRAATVSFKPLPGTRREGFLVARMLGVTAWIGEEALESRVKSLQSPRVVHLATHGFFLPSAPRRPILENMLEHILLDAQSRSAFLIDDPMYGSGLALAGAETVLSGGDAPPEAEDGLLTAADVIGMDLRGTELVVLSACETAIGEIRASEGVIGLRRAFAVAGAKTVVMSCWKVTDAATAELMERFYKILQAETPRASALRTSQLELKRRYIHPYFWAAFVLQGSTAPLRLAPAS